MEYTKACFDIKVFRKNKTKLKLSRDAKILYSELITDRKEVYMADKKLTKDDFIKAIGEMSVLELSEVVKALEDKFGVSAQAMVAAPAAGAVSA